jgi:protein-disulfide isomerase
MANKSNKHRNKKLTRFAIIALVVILVGSFIISRSENKVDPEAIANVETMELEPRIKANAEAELSLIKYSDFQCPACAQASVALEQLVDSYGSQFSFEYRHYPLRTIHPNAQLAAQAAEAAGVQGAFWEMHDMLFEKQSEWGRSINPKKQFKGYAEDLGLNVDRFEFDLESDEVKAKVNADADEAALLQLPGTPSFLVNGEVASIQDFTALLDLSAIETEEELEA